MKRIVLFFVCSVAAVVCRAEQADPQGQAIVTALQNRDAAQLLQLINTDALGKRVAKDVGLPAEQQSLFLEGIKTGINKVPDAMMQQFARTEPVVKLIRSTGESGQRRHLVRLDMQANDGGFDYLHFDTGYDGRIVDWYSYSQGNSASNLMTQRARSMLGDNAVLGKALDGDDFEPIHLTAYRRYNEYMLAGKFALAYVAMDQLPASFKKSQDWAALRVRLAAQMDEGTYRQALDFLAAGFSDVPELQFLLIDHYFLQQRYDEAIRSITAFEQFIGEDGATNLLKCTVYMQRGAFSEATQTCQRGIDVEPELKNLYWLLVSLGMQTGQNNLALTALSQYEAAFQLQFDPDKLAELDEYRELANTDEFRRWAELRRAPAIEEEVVEDTAVEP